MTRVIPSAVARPPAVEADPDVRATRLHALAALNRVISASLDPAVVLPAIGDAARHLMGADTVAFWIADEASATLTLSAFSGDRVVAREYPIKRMSFGEGGVGWVAAHRRLLHIADVWNDERCIARDWWKATGLRSMIAVPIMLDTTLLAVVAICGRAPFTLGPDEIDLLDTFVAQAAVAIHNARQFQESEARRRAAEALAQMGRVLAQALELSEVAQRIADAVCRLLDGQCSALFRRDAQSGDLIRLAVSGRAAPLGDATVFPDGQGVVGLAVRERRVVVTPDLLTDARVSLRPDIRARIDQAGYRAVLAVPLIVRDEVIGALAVGDAAGRVFDTGQISVAQTFADQAALALRNGQLYEEAQTRLARMRRLTELSEIMNSSLDLKEVLAFTTESIIELLNVDLARLWVLEDREGVLRLSAQKARAGMPEPIGATTELPVGRGAIGWVVENLTRRHSPDVRRDPLHVNRDWFAAHGYVSQIAVPLVVAGRAVGALSILTRAPRHFSREEEEVLDVFAAKAATAIANAQLYRRAEERAERLTALSTLTRLIISAEDSRRVYDEIARASTLLLGARMSRVWVDDAAAGVFRVEGTFCPDPDFNARATDFATLHRDRGILGAVVQSRAPEYITDLQQDPRYVNRELAVEGDFHVTAVIPLVNDDRVDGVLFIFFGRRAAFTDEEKALMQLLAGQAAIVLKKTRLYEETRRALANVKAKNAELDSFVYIVSHDLKAPLVAIEGMSTLLLEHHAAGLDERGRHYLTRIQHNVCQMERLIQDLLALSRVGREARAPETVGLRSLVEGIVAGLAGPIRSRGIQVTCVTDAVLSGIRTQLEQVMTNLVTNAVKYMGDTAAPRIEIGTVDAGDFVECYVRDNGIGIDPEYHGQIFELFQRLKDVEAEGSGVGLPIVKKIVEVAGGRVWVESARGQGATFRFTWPRNRPSA